MQTLQRFWQPSLFLQYQLSRDHKLLPAQSEQWKCELVRSESMANQKSQGETAFLTNHSDLCFSTNQ